MFVGYYTVMSIESVEGYWKILTSPILQYTNMVKPQPINQDVTRIVLYCIKSMDVIDRWCLHYCSFTQPKRRMSDLPTLYLEVVVYSD